MLRTQGAPAAGRHWANKWNAFGVAIGKARPDVRSSKQNPAPKLTPPVQKAGTSSKIVSAIQSISRSVNATVGAAPRLLYARSRPVGNRPCGRAAIATVENWIVRIQS